MLWRCVNAGGIQKTERVQGGQDLVRMTAWKRRNLIRVTKKGLGVRRKRLIPA